MRYIVVTGLSGAGKTGVLRYLEDCGFLCVDNLPPMMIPKFIELCQQGSTRIKGIAIAVDVRSGEFFDARGVCTVVEDAAQSGYPIETLYLEADDDTLIARYKETRRDHPLANGETTLIEAITAERERLQPLREAATYVVDTSGIRLKQTMKNVQKVLFANEGTIGAMRIEILSFGFKRGIPRESDLVFDVRFLPNPYYIPEICLYTGLEKPVRDYVLGHPITGEFQSHLYGLLDYLLPHYKAEGKKRLMVSIGCTGGAHRSVALSEALAKHLLSLGYVVDVNHRDIELEKMSWKNR